MPTAPALPPEAKHLWDAFLDLHAARPSSFGPTPITWGELDAYARLTDAGLDPWEVRAIRALDDAFLASRAEAPTPRPGAAP